MKNKTTEDKLTSTALASWNRLRSSTELQGLISRRELALASIYDGTCEDSL
jgi:hypothetical protein